MRTRFKIYTVLFVLLIIMFLRQKSVVSGAKDIAFDRESHVDNSVWDPVISGLINKNTLTFVIDSKSYVAPADSIYIDNERRIYIPASLLTNKFSCAYNYYEDTKAIIEKGETKAVVPLCGETVLINGVERELADALIEIEGVKYVRTDLMSMALGYTVEFDYEQHALVINNIRKDGSIIPSKYDYRTDGRLPLIKDQGNHSTCWAFASLTALESSIRPELIRSYSEKNMTLNNGYIVSLRSGGDYTMAVSYLASWRGPILASYEEGLGDYETPKDIPADVHVQEIQTIASKHYDEIKKMVFLYGGVESSIYMAIDSHDLDSDYYNAESYAYYYNDDLRPNHDIVIVGWDDNYPKENFSIVPEGNGAFICQNSWGESFGDKGIFYVSYYDTNIGTYNTAYTVVEPSDNYDHIYQTDICGMVGQLGYEGEDAFFANVYTAEGDEVLRAVSFYATGKDAEYDIYIVEDFENEKSFDKKKFIQKGSFENAGYYTVKLNSDIKLKAGHDYAVVIKIKVPGGERPIAVEYHKGYETSAVDISDGRGYISFAGKVWERMEETKNCNICLKMFTDDQKGKE